MNKDAKAKFDASLETLADQLLALPPEGATGAPGSDTTPTDVSAPGSTDANREADPATDGAGDEPATEDVSGNDAAPASASTPAGETDGAASDPDPFVKTVKIFGKTKTYDLRNPEQAKQYNDAAQRYLAGVDPFRAANNRYRKTLEAVSKLTEDLTSARAEIQALQTGGGSAANVDAAHRTVQTGLDDAQRMIEETDDPVLAAALRKAIEPMRKELTQTREFAVMIGNFLAGQQQNAEAERKRQQEAAAWDAIAATEPAARHEHVQMLVKRYAHDHGLTVRTAARMLFQQDPSLREYARLVPGAAAAPAVPASAAPAAAARKRAPIPPMPIPGGPSAPIQTTPKKPKTMDEARAAAEDMMETAGIGWK